VTNIHKAVLENAEAMTETTGVGTGIKLNDGFDPRY
jgi:hypothetical protein